MIEIRRLDVDDWRQWRALRLQALAEAPYAFGSTLAQWQGAGDLEERWRQRLTGVPLNLIADVDGQPAGMASGMPRVNEVVLLSMWVAPRGRGKGAGDALIEAVVDWAGTQAVSRVSLDVVAMNAYAIRFYQRHGFVQTSEADDPADLDPGEIRMLRLLK